MFKKTTFLSLALLAANHLSADIHNDYIFAKFGNKPIEEKKVENPLDQKFTFFKPEFFDAQTLNLSDRDAYENIFRESSSLNAIPFALGIIGEDTFKKLEIVIGDENKQASLILKKFDKHLSTASGSKKLITTLSNPTDDIQEIQNRQAIIRELIENEAFFNELDALVTQQTHAEKQLAALLGTTSLVNPHILKLLYFNIPGLKNLNTSNIALEISNKTIDSLKLIIGATSIPLNIIASLCQQYNIGITDACKILYYKAKAKLHLYSYIGIPKEEFLYIGGPLAFICAVQGFLVYTAFKNIKASSEVTKHIQQLLIDISTYTRTSEQIKHLISNNAVLSNNSEFTNILPGSTSDKLNNVLTNLNTNTFKGKPSFFSYSGRTLATYTKIQEVKNELIPLMEEIGTLDMYLAVAKLYKEHQNKKNSFCFAEFVENNTPMLQAEGFWNPFIDADVVVPNDAYLGNDVPNIILTGPNECGKSTILKGLTFNVLLAQTFGIAPAKSLRLTPFSKINCYLNITDDTSAGKSLFRAQVEMSKKLIEELRNMPSDKFVFTIMDELFTGTSAYEGEQVAYIYAEKLMVFENSIVVLATHFDKLKDLETSSNSKYINFQVEAIRAEDNTITRTFKMKPGFSTMNIAFDILTEAGVI